MKDYSPFGMMMPGRKFTAGSGYRYGFNGKENDNQVKGEGNQQDYGMRIYDPRLGRFLSVDPITEDYPELTPYQFSSNSPIAMIDIDGLEGSWYGIERNMLGNTDEFSKGLVDHYKKSATNIITATDVNDATVGVTMLTRGKNAINFDGTRATSIDKGFAVAGAVIPFISGSLLKQSLKWGARAAEWAYYATKGVKVADAVLGGSSALRSALMQVGSMVGKEAHHIIPTELLKNNDVVQDAVNAGFDFNGIINGIGIKKYTKAGEIAGDGGAHANHPNYTNSVLKKINAWADEAKENGTYSPQNAKKFLEGFANKLKKKIDKESVQGGTKVNELVF